jgi:rubrerythrin
MEDFKTVNDILDFAIQGEQEAVDFYSGLSRLAKNQEMKDIFMQFAAEEMSHKAKLLKIKEEGVFALHHESIPDLKIADYLVNAEATPEMNYQDALVVAMQKEKAAFKLYTRLAEKAPNPALKDLFLSLAQEESKHKLRFEVEYDDFILREN